MRSERPLAAAAAAAALMLGLTACGTTEEPAGTASSAQGQPVSITDSRGKTIELSAPAEKVVGTEWNVVENLVSLGIMPVGAADPAGYGDYVGAAPLDDTVTDIGTRGEPSIDTVASLAPDLIVATNDLSDSAIAQLEEVAPTIVIKSADTAGQIALAESNLELIGQATGTESQAQTVITQFHNALEKDAQTLADAGLDGAQVAVADGYVYEGATTIRPYTSKSLMGEVFTELGLVSPWTIDGDAAYGLASTDVEGLTGLETDYLAVFNASSDLTAALNSNGVWTTLPVVQAQKALFLDDPVWSFGGPASMAQAADVLTAALTK